MTQGAWSNLVHHHKLLQMVFLLGIGGNFLIGYQTSVINSPSVDIKRFMNKTWQERSGAPLPEKTLLFLWSLVVSIYGVGGLLGCLCSSYLTVEYGKYVQRCREAQDVCISATKTSRSQRKA